MFLSFVSHLFTSRLALCSFELQEMRPVHVPYLYNVKIISIRGIMVVV
jgi:hypothetical protein